jgi:hypothetical protein
MKKFAINLAVFGLIVLAVLAAIFFVPVPFYGFTPIDTLALYFNKQELARQESRHKVLIIGGSGTFYGVSAEQINRHYRVPVINMGLFAGFGLRQMLDSVLQESRAGDVAVIIPEYMILNGLLVKHIDHNSLARDILYVDNLTTAHRYIRDFDPAVLVMTVVKTLQYKLGSLYNMAAYHNPDAKYWGRGSETWRFTMNEFGDNICLPKSYKGAMKERTAAFPMEVSPEAIALINDFSKACAAKQVKAVFAYPVYPRSIYDIDRPKVDTYYAELEKKLDITVLGPVGNYVFDDSLFLDTANHLNAQGRPVRTARLIEDLQPVMAGFR